MRMISSPSTKKHAVSAPPPISDQSPSVMVPSKSHQLSAAAITGSIRMAHAKAMPQVSGIGWLPAGRRNTTMTLPKA